MISASKFYSRPKTKPRYTTLVEAQDYALFRNCRNIVILPPKSATIDQDSDTENILEKFVDEDAMFWRWTVVVVRVKMMLPTIRRPIIQRSLK